MKTTEMMEKFEKKRIRVKQTKRFIKHMEQHHKDFIIPYWSFIGDIRSIINEYHRGENFIEFCYQHYTDVGYSNINRIENPDNIVYAKRKGRELYSKFELNREKRLTNKVVVVLKQSYYNENEYHLITMFPGDVNIKEVGDKNIKSIDEFNRVNKFWSNNALVFELDKIEEDTITSEKPYDL